MRFEWMHPNPAEIFFTDSRIERFAHPESNRNLAARSGPHPAESARCEQAVHSTTKSGIYTKETSP